MSSAVLERDWLDGEEDLGAQRPLREAGVDVAGPAPAAR